MPEDHKAERNLDKFVQYKAKVKTYHPELRTFFYELYTNEFSAQVSINTALSYIRAIDSMMDYFMGQSILSGPKANLSATDLALLEYPDILEAIGELSIDKKRSSTNQMISAIKSLFHYLFSMKFIPIDIGALVKSKKVETNDTVDAFSDEEVKLMLKFVRHGYVEVNGITKEFPTKRGKTMWKKSRLRDYAIFKIFLSMGLRLEELTILNLDDVLNDTDTVQVRGKGRKTRQLYFSPSVKAAIIDYVQNERPRVLEEALFLTHYKEIPERLKYRTIQDLVVKYTTLALGKPKNPHRLRATCATMITNRTEDIQVVSDYLGHEDINTTRRYSKVNIERRKQIAMLLD